jgi:hypothetical protein
LLSGRSGRNGLRGRNGQAKQEVPAGEEAFPDLFGLAGSHAFAAVLTPARDFCLASPKRAL